MKNTPAQPDTAALEFAWSGEIYGMAFFQQLLNHYPAQREVWSALYDIEAFTEHYLRQRLASVLTLSEQKQSELINKGVNDASEWLALTWQLLCPRMRDWIAPWQQTYACWQQQAQQWQAEFSVIYLHENIIFNYWTAAALNNAQAYSRLQQDFVHLQQLASE